MDDLMERYKRACDLTNPVDRVRIREQLMAWWKRVSATRMKFGFVENSND